MQLLEEYKSDMRKLKTLLERGVDYRTVAAILAQSQYILKDYPDERKYCFAYSKAVKDISLQQYAETLKPEWDDLYWNTMLWEAPELLDSYMIYIERNREPQARFYLPRRKTLIRIVNKLQMLADDELDELFIHLPGRTGKAEPLDAKVLTEDGFVEMRHIKVGSRVISGDGEVCNVIGVFPQGTKDVYRVRFTDGTSAECCKEHLWRVQTPDDRRKDRGGERYRIVETQDMIGNLKVRNGKESKYSVDYVEPVKFPKKELKIDPYVFGVLVGDGCLTSGSAIIANPERDIFEKIKLKCNGKFDVQMLKKDGKCPRFSIKGMTGLLREYGIYMKRSEEKSIPWEYLHSSVEDRIDLLMGLCDSDGSVSKGEFIDYSTSSEQLSSDIVYLVRSLGGRATVKKSGSHYTKNNVRRECKERYRITFTLNGKFVPVSSEKHLKKYVKNKTVTKKFIESIEFSRRAECQCIMVDSPSHLYVTDDFIVTHNTQSITEFNAWYASKYPDKSNLYCSYSDAVAKSYYDGMLELLTDPTYLHSEVFPQSKIVSTDAKGNTIDLVRKKKYKSITCKGLTAGLNGLCDCTGIEIGDDLIEGIQDAMNPDILKRKQTIVDNNYIPRAKTGAKRLWCGTSWALQDPYQNRLEFLKNNPKAKYIRWDVIKIPALNENDESNFDYDYDVGFSTQHYQQIRAKFEANEDMASWLAQYQQEPIEREGALFTPEFMRFYDGSNDLPAGEPDNIVAACDVAFGGSDFLAFGVLYVYGEESYLVDCIFDNHEKDITQPRIVQMIVKHQVQRSFWEYNNGGEGFKDDIKRLLKEKGYVHNMIGNYAPTKMRKEDRIFDAAPEIRKIYFLSSGFRDQDYQKMMQNVFSYKVEGKNKHEDACDMLAYLVKIRKNKPSIAKLINSPI